MVHRITKMTPYDARKPKNQLIVKHNLELNAKRGRIYPDINIGDKVKNIQRKNHSIKNM
jgi:hypothetical protein